MTFGCISVRMLFNLLLISGVTDNKCNLFYPRQTWCIESRGRSQAPVPDRDLRTVLFFIKGSDESAAWYFFPTCPLGNTLLLLKDNCWSKERTKPASHHAVSLRKLAQMISEEKIDNCNDVMVPLLFRAIFQKGGWGRNRDRNGGGSEKC